MVNRKNFHDFLLFSLLTFFILHFSQVSSFIGPTRRKHINVSYRITNKSFLSKGYDNKICSYSSTPWLLGSRKLLNSFSASRKDFNDHVEANSEEISSAAKEFVDSKIEDLIASGVYDPEEAELDENPQENMSILEKLEKKYLDDEDEEYQEKEGEIGQQYERREDREVSLSAEKRAFDDLPLHQQYVEEFKTIKYKPLGWVLKNTFIIIWLLILCVGLNFMLTELFVPLARDFYHYNPTVRSKNGVFTFRYLVTDFKVYINKVPNRILNYFKTFNYFEIVEKQERQFYNPWAAR